MLYSCVFHRIITTHAGDVLASAFATSVSRKLQMVVLLLLVTVSLCMCVCYLHCVALCRYTASSKRSHPSLLLRYDVLFHPIPIYMLSYVRECLCVCVCVVS